MFSGCFTAIATPMTESGAIDWQAWQVLLQQQLTHTDGVVLFGSTAEAMSLSDQEITEMLNRAAKIKLSFKNKKLIVGIPETVTHKVVERLKHLSGWSVDAVMTVCPYYLRPTQSGVYKHFEQIAKSTYLPIILYNVPTRTASEIATETVIELAQIDNIHAIKDADTSPKRLAAMKEKVPETFSFLSGDDATAESYIKQGGHGVISVVSNIKPREMKSLVDKCLNEKFCHDTWAQLLPFIDACSVESNPAAVKWLLSIDGFGTGTCRLPVCHLSRGAVEKIQSMISIRTA